MSQTHTNHPSAVGDAQREQELQQIRDSLRGLKFGAVNIIVQDGVVVQIDRTEKRRLRTPNAAAESALSGR